MKRAFDWVSVNDELPALGDQVVVYNGVHLWLTGWKPGLLREDVKYPVTHWARPVGLPYELRYSAVDVDPQCYAHETAGARKAAKLRRRQVA